MATKSAQVRSPLRYSGGKGRAAQFLASLMPKCKEYREPFVGGGSVFLEAKQQNRADIYLISDIDWRLIDFYWAIQNPEERKRVQDLLREYLSYGVNKDSFKQEREYFLETFERGHFKCECVAAAYFMVNRCAFSGNMEGGFSSSAAKERFTPSSVERLDAFGRMLEGVHIFSGDFESVLTLPGDDVFFFLDPPYFCADGIYTYEKMDHERLAWLLRNSSHRFLLTYDDCPEVRELYGHWAKRRRVRNCLWHDELRQRQKRQGRRRAADLKL